MCAECHKGSEDAGHGRRDHASLLNSPGAVVVSCAAVSLDATQAARASLTNASVSKAHCVKERLADGTKVHLLYAALV